MCGCSHTVNLSLTLLLLISNSCTEALHLLQTGFLVQYLNVFEWGYHVKEELGFFTVFMQKSTWRIGKFSMFIGTIIHFIIQISYLYHSVTLLADASTLFSLNNLQSVLKAEMKPGMPAVVGIRQGFAVSKLLLSGTSPWLGENFKCGDISQHHGYGMLHFHCHVFFMKGSFSVPTAESIHSSCVSCGYKKCIWRLCFYK